MYRCAAVAAVAGLFKLSQNFSFSENRKVEEVNM